MRFAVLLGCITATWLPAHADISAGGSLDEDAYAVYVVAMRTRIASGLDGFLARPVPVARTARVSLPGKAPGKQLAALLGWQFELKGLGADTLQSYRAAKPATLDGRNFRGLRAVLVDAPQGRVGSLQPSFVLSTVGFNLMRDQALLVVRYDQGFAADATAYLLAKRNGKWVVAESQRLYSFIS